MGHVAKMESGVSRWEQRGNVDAWQVIDPLSPAALEFVGVDQTHLDLDMRETDSVKLVPEKAEEAVLAMALRSCSRGLLYDELAVRRVTQRDQDLVRDALASLRDAL